MHIFFTGLEIKVGIFIDNIQAAIVYYICLPVLFILVPMYVCIGEWTHTDIVIWTCGLFSLVYFLMCLHLLLPVISGEFIFRLRIYFLLIVVDSKSME